jgi:hypothetical protein
LSPSDKFVISIVNSKDRSSNDNSPSDQLLDSSSLGGLSPDRERLRRLRQALVNLSPIRRPDQEDRRPLFARSPETRGRKVAGRRPEVAATGDGVVSSESVDF